MTKTRTRHLFTFAEAHNRIKSTYAPAIALVTFKRRSKASIDGKARVDKYKHIVWRDMDKMLRLGL